MAPSIRNRLFQIGKGFGAIPVNIAAVAIAGRNILVNAIVTFDQFGKSQILEFGIGLGRADIGAGNEFAHGRLACGAAFQGAIADGLPDFKDFPKSAVAFLVFIFINGHF